MTLGCSVVVACLHGAGVSEARVPVPWAVTRQFIDWPTPVRRAAGVRRMQVAAMDAWAWSRLRPPLQGTRERHRPLGACWGAPCLQRASLRHALWAGVARTLGDSRDDRSAGYSRLLGALWRSPRVHARFRRTAHCHGRRRHRLGRRRVRHACVSLRIPPPMPSNPNLGSPYTLFSMFAQSLITPFVLTVT